MITIKSEIRNSNFETNYKYETRNSKPSQTRSKQYDLEERTFQFAKQTRTFVKELPKTTGSFEDISQLVRSSASVGANYIEANESLGRKDFFMKIKISRKEAKESRFWLRLVDTNNKEELEKERQRLIQEATELMNIFGSIFRKGQHV